MTRKTLIAVFLIGCCAVCMAAVLADLNGKWSGVLNAPDGNQYPLAYTFKVDGNKLSGTLEATGMSVPIDSGMVNGDNVKFSIAINGQTFAHNGKYYAAGDSVGMDVDFMGTKTHTTLKRTP